MSAKVTRVEEKDSGLAMEACKVHIGHLLEDGAVGRGCEGRSRSSRLHSLDEGWKYFKNVHRRTVS